MRLADLEHDQRVRARWGRYVEGRDTPKWGPWADALLHVQRVPPPRRGQRTPRSLTGTIAVLALKRLDGSFVPWAEYAERDFDPRYKVFLVEDYYLEIEGLEP